MKLEKNNSYKIKLSTMWITKEYLESILTKVTNKLKKEYDEVDLYGMVGVIEHEQLTTESERGIIFYFFISTYDNMCLVGEDCEEIYIDDTISIEIGIEDLIETAE